jgi:glycosyltransferase involved in cell wall biosynthesis
MQTQPWVPVEEFVSSVRGAFDVGIVPLERSAFNDAKSNLKGLEFAACGIPFVASPSPEYQLICSQGAGVLAGPFQWRQSLTTIAKDPDLRLHLGSRALSTVMENYVMEDHAHDWLAAWTLAADLRSGVGHDALTL